MPEYIPSTSPKEQYHRRYIIVSAPNRLTVGGNKSESAEQTARIMTMLTLMAVFPYLLGVGLVLLLHSFRSRATSWVTPTHVMSSLICWCHVFLGRPRRLVPGIASSITLRVTLSASRLWTCPNQRRRPPRITSSIGEMCSRGIQCCNTCHLES